MITLKNLEIPICQWRNPWEMKQAEDTYWIGILKISDKESRQGGMPAKWKQMKER